MNYKFGKLMRKYRVKVGLSQREVAEELGINGPQFISNIERGISLVPIKSIPKFVDIYDLDTREFVSAYETALMDKTKHDIEEAFNG